MLHNAAYKYLGLNHWTYGKVEVSESTLSNFISSLTSNWAGFSVTMPLKQLMFNYADEIDDIALQANAINTVIRLANGQLLCYNTDVDGIIRALNGATCTTEAISTNQTALIVGSGATARSAFVALQDMGVPKIWVTSRRQPEWAISTTSSSARRLVNSSVNTKHTVTWINLHNDLFSFLHRNQLDVIVSTLPWQPAQELLPPFFSNYNGKLLECAFPKVLPHSIDGSVMLIHQAIHQIELMTGQTVPYSILETALNNTQSSQ